MLPTPTLRTVTGWLASDGLLFPCHFDNYESLVDPLMARYRLNRENPLLIAGILEGVGFIKLIMGQFYIMHPRISFAQLETMVRYQKEYRLTSSHLLHRESHYNDLEQYHVTPTPHLAADLLVM